MILLLEIVAFWRPWGGNCIADGLGLWMNEGIQTTAKKNDKKKPG